MKLKTLIKRIDKLRFQPVNGSRWLVRSGGYKFNTMISLMLLGVIIGLFGVILIANNFSMEKHYYYKCGSSPCQNYFYQKCPMDWCNEEILPAGFVYGSPPSWLVVNYDSIVMWLCVGALVFNHLLYNFFKEVEEK